MVVASNAAAWPGLAAGATPVARQGTSPDAPHEGSRSRTRSASPIGPFGVSRDEVRGVLGGPPPAGTEVVVAAKPSVASGNEACDAPGSGLDSAARAELAAVSHGRDGVCHDVVSPDGHVGSARSWAPGCTGGAADGLHACTKGGQLGGLISGLSCALTGIINAVPIDVVEACESR